MHQHERVHFRLMCMPCCGQMLCWVNPRLPMYCPECGRMVLGKLQQSPDSIRITDYDAELNFDTTS